MDIQDKELQERFELLPDEVAVVVADPETGDIITKICKDIGVPLSQIGYVIAATSLVLLGENKVRDFEDVLKEVVDMREEEIEDLAKQIFVAIFQPISPELDQLFQDVHRGQTLESIPRVIPTPTPTGPATTIQSPGNSPQTPSSSKIKLNFPGSGPVEPRFTPSTPPPAPTPAPTPAPKPIYMNSGPVPLMEKPKPASSFTSTPRVPEAFQSRFIPPAPRVNPDHMLEDHAGNMDNVVVIPESKTPSFSDVAEGHIEPKPPGWTGADPYREEI